MSLKLTIFLFTSLCITTPSMAFRDDINGPLPHISGPNCWNQALINSKLLKIHRYTSPQEFTYLVSNHCKQTLTPTEGSLGRITKDGNEYHAFTWLSENLVHAKNSMGALESPRVMTFTDMFETYPVAPECINRVNSGTNCETEIRYYNCSELKIESLIEHAQLNDIELTLHEIIYDPSTMKGPGFRRCDTSPIEQRIRKLNHLSEQLEILEELNPSPSEYKLAWLDSIVYQIQDIEASSSSSVCLLENDSEKRTIFPIIYNQLNKLLNP